MEKTCFVIMGFGVKTDFRTGRKIDLDKTYKNVIKPVFEGLGFFCLRADEIKHTGVIDKHMFEGIVKADFVVADISTLNPNSLYELGVRHAVKKHTTLIMAEKEMEYPFDVNHIAIDHYEHLGSDIGYSEVLRIKEHLKKKVTALMENPEVDSPLYTLIPNLQAPTFTEEEIEELKEESEELKSISQLLEESEVARKENNFEVAITLLEEARAVHPQNDFITQRLVSVIYKSELPNRANALHAAEKILTVLKPDKSNDPETLGLAGAINKRLFEEYKDEIYLKKAMSFYQRGFIIEQDYYNGINYAFMCTLNSTMRDSRFEAHADYGNGMLARKQVINMCNEIVDDSSFEERDDQERVWIFLTLAECYFATEDLEKEEQYVNEAKKCAELGDFEFNSYYEQREKLETAINTFKEKYGSE